MVNTRKIFWLLAVLSLVFLILEIDRTESKSINQDNSLKSHRENVTISTNYSHPLDHEDNTAVADEQDLDSSGDNHDDDPDSSTSGAPPFDDDQVSPKGIDRDDDYNDNNQNDRFDNEANLAKSKVPGSSEKPIFVPSYDPVDNTDLSLEKPDLPNDENVVMKDVENTRTPSPHLPLKEIYPHDDKTEDQTLNDTNSVEDSKSGFSGNSESEPDIFLEKGNVTKETQSNHTLDHTFDKVNKTAASTKKLFDFLDISENYTKNSLNISKTANFNNTHPPGTHKLGFLNQAKKVSKSSSPINSVKSVSPYSFDSRNSQQSKYFSNGLNTVNRVGASRPYYTTTAYSRPNMASSARYYPLNSNMNSPSYQNTLNPYQAKLINPQTASPYYSWYQRRSQWPYKTAYQIPGRQLPNYPKQASYTRPVTSWYNTNGAVYQRSNVPRPNTVLNSQGHAPFEVFEDALVQKKQQLYQNYPYYRNANLPVNTVKSFRSNPFLRPRTGNSSPYGQSTRMYTGAPNALLKQLNKTSLKPAQNHTKKHAFNVFQAAIYFADLLKNESARLDSVTSGDGNGIPEYLKDGDDDLNNESDNGSGDVFVKEKPKAREQSSVFTDKQVNKLIQAEDLGASEREGSAENAIPEFKEAEDGSGEVIDIENKDKNNQENSQNSIENLDKTPSTIQSSVPSETEMPTIVTGGQETTPQATAAVQPAAQVFNDAAATANVASQSYDYAATPSADQAQPNTAQTAQPAAQAYASQAPSTEENYNDASSQAAPATQYYNDASAQATQAAQPAAQSYSDTSQQTNSAAAQYYTDAASQAAPAAQPGVQAYATPPTEQQNDAEKVPQPVDVAMTANKPETANYASSPASQPSEVYNDANGVPQSVDAATMASPPQTQYYNNPQQTMPQQTGSNDLASSFMSNTNAASQQWDNTATAAQQPMQYATNQEQNTQAYSNQDTQSAQDYQAPPTNGAQLRKLDVLDENKFRTVVCQNNQQTITCPQGKKINITDAHYGSMGLSDCQGPESNSFLPIQPCETPNAYKTVKTSCDDTENCMLSANDGIFGDQCQSDKKYLDVTYSCEDNRKYNDSRKFHV